ncbi:deoxyguanosinetriphosphate triphosphohydrolase [Corynebacterium choanae]|uniref:deoxyguanosinetriphosphate triphosphohydrolase n=1 Tax=Corynebacterium choanae TaxID=1862358 RepID=UPI002482B97D|nr:deoxyguanosinetriphosphate triphosphohydrolase [Corynebacterium choanae]
MDTQRSPYRYTVDDCARLLPEAAKTHHLVDSPELRHPFARDRARVLHSAAFRRLADKTQVVGPQAGDTPRTRLTHSLEVAQIARAIGTGLGADPDLCELAGLTHDIGHPPYGHNGEVALNELGADCGGFEGNAQTLRILGRLEPKILDEEGNSYGLNLTRAALDAACKYPWTRTNPDGSVNRKYGCYDEDLALLQFARAGHVEGSRIPPLEGQVMDFADDIAYSVHDVEDGIIAGRISLAVLWDFVELASLANRGAEVYGGSPEELLAAADRLRQLSSVIAAAEFSPTLKGLAGLKRLTSELVGRYIGATIAASNQHNEPIADRLHGQVVRPAEVQAEVTLLKTLAVLYVMDEPSHLSNQDRQRDRIARVFDFYQLTAPESLDPMFAAWFVQAENDAAKTRVIIDQIASLTETALQTVAKRAHSIASFYG